MLRRHVLAVAALATFLVPAVATADQPLRVGTFAVDASPAVGKPMAYDPTKGVDHPLSCKGVVLIGDDAPIVLVAIDWIGVANDGQREFREALARAAATTVERVEVHALHQHDAPRMDLSADAILSQIDAEAAREYDDVDLARDVIVRCAAAVREAVADARPVTHVGLGQGIVEKVASTRRLMNPEGTKVVYVRWSSCADPKGRALPEGLIDPALKMISFWNGEKPVAVMTFYATHPQSYYRTGLANPDFPGIARDQREKDTGIFHVHFNGASGNVAAGKYNDGTPPYRRILADRVKAGMDAAWAATEKTPISSADLDWRTVKVALPVDPELNAAELEKQVADESQTPAKRGHAARDLAWIRRCEAGDRIDVSVLKLGEARVPLLPGELFVEYQLAAQKLRPDLFVAMAAYGDYGPGYIGTEAAYSQGGYETGRHVSRVAPSVEGVLMGAIRELLRD